MISIFMRLHRYLNEWPNSYLTIALLIAAVVIAAIALTGDGLTKAIVLAYVVFP